MLRKSSLVAVGLIASASAALSGRDSQSGFDSAAVQPGQNPYAVASLYHPQPMERNDVRVAAIAPFGFGQPVDRMRQQDDSPPQAFESHPGMGPQTGRPGAGIVKASLNLPDLSGLGAPGQDWNSPDTALVPRFPEVGPVPLVPGNPDAAERDTMPKIDRRPEGRMVESTVAQEDESLEDLLIRAGVREQDLRATLVALRADDIGDVLDGGERLDMAFSGDRSMLLGLRIEREEREPVELRWDGETDPLWALLELDSSDTPQGGTLLAKPETNLTATADGQSTAFVNGEITATLYGAAQKVGMSPRDTQRLTNLFRYIVDFERDLRKGDRFEVLFAKQPGGAFGDILYAKLTNRGSEIALYRGQNEYGEDGYYDATGRSNKRALMRTPIAGGRVSSNFGMRRHPILGYDKMHRGVDFAAPTGTPVFAAGDGIVDYVGRRGTAGKYIRIRHSSIYKTAYAHLSRYAKLRKGQRVKQGQVIGYVGSTGRSTGPHLHFEIIENGHRINPMQVADFGDINGLTGPYLSTFKARVARIEVAIGLLHENRMAAAE